MEYELAKWVHILSATLLFGTGLGSAFYKWSTDRSGDLRAIAQTNKIVVIADWLFTTPTIIIQPLSGIWLANIMGYPLTEPWLLATYILYAIAGGCWLPVVWLQIRMRDVAQHTLQQQLALDKTYRRYARIWFWLGMPAFASMVTIFYLMVSKPAFGL